MTNDKALIVYKRFLGGLNMDILNNAWVVGIVGGILSGLIVTFISRLFFSKKENDMYIQNLRLANNEVIYALRPAISANQFPSEDIINALIEANSRKFKVNREDMYNPREVAEELTKEIMDTSFIPYEKKEELFKHLVELYSSDVSSLKVLTISKNEEVQEYKKRLLDRVTLMLGFMTTSFVLMLTIYRNYYSTILKESNEQFLLLSMLIILVVPMLFSVKMLPGSIRRSKRKRSRKENKREEKLEV